MKATQIKKIIPGCKKATFLIEKEQTGNLNKRELLVLNNHLSACSGCRIFAEQSKMINKALHNLLHEPKPKFKLDEDDKMHMQDLIDERFGNFPFHYNQ